MEKLNFFPEPVILRGGAAPKAILSLMYEVLRDLLPGFLFL